MTQETNRSRLLYVLFVAVTIVLGLLSRSNLIPMPSFISTYAGDILWALMVFWIFCVLFNQQATWRLALYAIVFSFSIEFAQFYHELWIDEIRHTKLGGLILGYAFKLSDLICYFLGILIGALADYLICHQLFKNKVTNVYEF